MGDRSLDIEERFAEGLEAHRQGNGEAALAAYKDVLAANPDHPDGLHYLGLLLFKKDDPEDALSLIRHSLHINENNAFARNNLGNILKLIGRREEAFAEYILAVELDSDQKDAWHNLGILAGEAGRSDELLRRLADLKDRYPNKGDAWRIYGLAAGRAGKLDEAAEALDTGLTLGVETPFHAVRAVRFLHELGHADRATEHLEKLVDQNPDDTSLKFHLAAARGEKLAQVPEDYVKSHFDSFSDSFDEVLEILEYNTPQRVANAVKLLAERSGAPFPDVADLGCGTGLCGPLIRDVSGRLTGVDLSPGMLQKAAQRNAYDFLVEGELIAFLNADLPTHFDLCVCVDTLCYLGDLTPFFEALDKALKPGGVLVASVEMLETDKEAFQLNASGRYAHNSDHIRRTVEAVGLRYGPEETSVLRKEFGKGVEGLVFHVFKDP